MQFYLPRSRRWAIFRPAAGGPTPLDEDLHRNGLGKLMDDPETLCGCRGFNGSMGGDENDPGIRAMVSTVFEEVEACAVAEVDVGDDDIEGFL